MVQSVYKKQKQTHKSFVAVARDWRVAGQETRVCMDGEKWGGEWRKTLSTQDLDPTILTLPPNTNNSVCPIILKHFGPVVYWLTVHNK